MPMSIVPTRLIVTGTAAAALAGLGAATALGGYPSYPSTPSTTPAVTTPPAAATAPPLKIVATLTPGQETPRPKGSRGSGTFVGTLKGRTLTYTLTFRRLSGPAIASHLHRGKPGTAGPIAVPLCPPPSCTSPLKGTKTVPKSFVAALKAGGAYVNVHTAKNAGGEVRGLIRVKA
jgi:CHRD domain-containing protein